jgi:hypothetical protein
VEWLSAALEEYKSLRAESLAAIEQAQRSVQLGLAGIAAITAFSASGSQNTVVAGFITAVAGLVFAAPLVVLWALEVRRSINAGAHVAGLEARIDKHCAEKEPPLRWETTIQRGFTTKGAYVYDWAVFLTLSAATLPSVTIGFAHMVNRHADPAWIVGAALVDIGTVAFMTSFLRRRHTEMTNVHLRASGR